MKASKTKDFKKLQNLKSIITENIFDKSSIIYLSDVSEHPDLVDIFKKDAENYKIVNCARNGLNLLKYDDQKEVYWMADYRYVSRVDLIPAGYS